VIEQGQLLQLDQAERRDLAETSTLRADWERLRGRLQGISPVEIRDLLQELGILGLVGPRQNDLERLCRQMQPLLADTPLEHLPDEFRAQSTRLTLLLEKAAVREAIGRQQTQAHEAIRCSEFRDSLVSLFAQMQHHLDEPPWNWGPLVAHLRQLRTLQDLQESTGELWERTLAKLSTPLSEWLNAADFRFEPDALERLEAALTRTERRLRDEESQAHHQQQTLEAAFVVLEQPLPVEALHTFLQTPPEPPFTAGLFRRLSEVIQGERALQALRELLDQHAQQLLPPLEEHLRKGFAGPIVRGLLPRGDEAGTQQSIRRLLRDLLQRRDDALPHALRALPRVVQGLRLHADLRGENRSPAGYRLLAFPLAEQLQPEYPVTLLRDLCHREVVLAELLSNPLALDSWEGELRLVAELRPQRRWWSVLYRELHDRLVDQLTQVEIADPRYRLCVLLPQASAVRVEVRPAIERLERMAREVASLPPAIAQVLREHRLLPEVKA
jgi:hypothetical protein